MFASGILSLADAGLSFFSLFTEAGAGDSGTVFFWEVFVVWLGDRFSSYISGSFISGSFFVSVTPVKTGSSSYFCSSLMTSSFIPIAEGIAAVLSSSPSYMLLIGMAEALD